MEILLNDRTKGSNGIIRVRLNDRWRQNFDQNFIIDDGLHQLLAAVIELRIKRFFPRFIVILVVVVMIVE